MRYRQFSKNPFPAVRTLHVRGSHADCMTPKVSAPPLAMPIPLISPFPLMLSINVNLLVPLKSISGNCLAVQWLGLRAFPARSAGSIPGRGTKIPRAERPKTKKQKPKKLPMFNVKLLKYIYIKYVKSISEHRPLLISQSIFQTSYWVSPLRGSRRLMKLKGIKSNVSSLPI